MYRDPEAEDSTYMIFLKNCKRKVGDYSSNNNCLLEMEVDTETVTSIISADTQLSPNFVCSHADSPACTAAHKKSLHLYSQTAKCLLEVLPITVT